jgi:hypothetical protein
MPDPQFHSLALDAIPKPDFADVHVVPLPPGASTDPQFWVEQIFDIASTPAWVIALMGVRQAVVGLIGVRPGTQHAFDIDRVVGEEALIDTDDRHLRFCCGVAVDAERSLLRVTTTVQLKGWRGQVYFTPVSVLHGRVVRAMMIKAVSRERRRGRDQWPRASRDRRAAGSR